VAVAYHIGFSSLQSFFLYLSNEGVAPPSRMKRFSQRPIGYSVVFRVNY